MDNTAQAIEPAAPLRSEATVIAEPRRRGGGRLNIIGLVLTVLSPALLVAYPWFYDRFLSAGAASLELRALEEKVERHPDDVQARLELAVAYQQFGYLHKAESQAGEIIKRDPGSAGARYVLASVLLQRRRYGQAEPVLKEVLRLDPRHKLAMMELGRLYLERRRYDEALAVLSELAVLWPDAPAVQDALAKAFDGAGRAREAAAARAAAAKMREAQVKSHFEEVPWR